MEFLSVKGFLSTNFDEFAEKDDFISIIVHVLFNFLIEDFCETGRFLIRKNRGEISPKSEKSKEKSTEKTNEKKIEKSEKSEKTWEKSEENSKEKREKTWEKREKFNEKSKEKSERISKKRGKPKINTRKILATLDFLFPSVLYDKTFAKLLKILEFSFFYQLKFEVFIVKILWKRSINLKNEVFLIEFLKILMYFQRKDDVFLQRILKEIPDFLYILRNLSEKIQKKRVFSEKCLIIFDGFLGVLLYSEFYQENGFKTIKFTILSSEISMGKTLMLSMNLAIIIVEKMSSELRVSKNALDFLSKNSQIMRNIVFFCFFLEDLPDFLRKNEILLVYHKFLEKFVEICEILEILFAVFPKPNFNLHEKTLDFEDLWEKLRKEGVSEEIYMKKGGIFYCLLNSIFNLYEISLEFEGFQLMRVHLLGLIWKLFFPLKKKTSEHQENFDFFENSDTIFKRLFSEKLAKFPEKNRENEKNLEKNMEKKAEKNMNFLKKN